MLAGGACLALAGATAGELSALRPDTFSTASVLALAYLVVFGSLVAFSTFVWLLHNAPLPLVATYAYVNPVVAVLLGWAILGEPLTFRLGVAGAIVVTGVALIASAVPPTPDDDESAGHGSPRRGQLRISSTRSGTSTSTWSAGSRMSPSSMMCVGRLKRIESRWPRLSYSSGSPVGKPR